MEKESQRWTAKRKVELLLQLIKVEEARRCLPRARSEALRGRGVDGDVRGRRGARLESPQRG